MGTEEGRGWRDLNSCSRCLVQGQPSLPGVGIASASDLSLRPEPAEAWVLPSDPSGSAIQGPSNPLWGHREACRGWSLGPDSAHPGFCPASTFWQQGSSGVPGALEPPLLPLALALSPTPPPSLLPPAPVFLALLNLSNPQAVCSQGSPPLISKAAAGHGLKVQNSLLTLQLPSHTPPPKTIAAKSTRESPGLGA